MKEYLDETYAALDGVLLSYIGNDVSLKIPGRLANMNIHTLGQGSLMDSSILQQVVVPDGVERIESGSFASCDKLMNVYIPYSVSYFGERAFQSCSKLRNLYVYGIDLNEQKYRDLISSSRRVNGSLYLAPSFPEFDRAKNAVASTDAGIANTVWSGAARLFTSYSLEEDKGAASLQRNLDGFSFESDDRYTTETDAFLRLIKNEGDYEVDTVSEEKNDQFLRSDKFPPIEKTAVFTFDDRKTKVENGRYVIFANIKIGYHFWQSKVPVIISGITYFVYRRHYLSSKPNLNYVRRDTAVFTQKGPLLNRKEVQEVYAKYKLLSIL